MRLRITPSARDAIRSERAWCEANREKPPRLFVSELALVLAKLRNGTDTARQRYSGLGTESVWRLLMPKTRHHVY